MSSMEEKLSAVKREVLVEMVKLAQKRGFKGSHGGWKDFLKIYDKKIGASVSDPARRSTEELLAFLKTLSQEDDLKFFDKVLQCHSNRDAVEQFQKTSPDTESPETPRSPSSLLSHSCTDGERNKGDIVKMSSMEEKLSAVKREVLVKMVKLSQKRGFKGSNGGWKEFLKIYDKKIGASVSDPARRSTEELLAFLKTLSQEDDLKFFDKVLQCHSNRAAVEQFQKTSPDTESPETPRSPSSLLSHSCTDGERNKGDIVKMSSMEEKLSAVKREVLVEMVKLAQKRGFKGSNGGWKEFLNIYDKKIGASVSDPARRSTEELLAFLKTLSQEDDLKFFDKVLQCHSNRDAVEQFQETSPDTESPEQKLVRLTLEHPQYPIEYSFPSHKEGWLVMKHRKNHKAMRSTAMVAVDCEMVLCEDGTEALVRVCVVDRNLEVKLDEFVKPKRAITDYRTEITGITAGDLEGVNYSLADLQKSMKKLLSHGTILVGHSLNNDLQALKLDHARVIDTSYLYMYGDGASSRKLSLNSLCKSVFGYELRKRGAPHNCLDDACAAMKLVLSKIEHGVDRVIPVVSEEVQEMEMEMEMEKLLVHRIPIKVRAEDLHEIIPGEFTVEAKATRKNHGDTYNALVTFKDEREARKAFEILEGDEEKDSFGRSQKKIHFQLSTGTVGTLLVRKMAPDSSGNSLSKKRSLQHEEVLDDAKKPRTENDVGNCGETMTDTNHCENHLREIERLQRELSQREQEISSLNKILVALTRKQAL